MRAWVALILALCVLVFFIAGSVLPQLLSANYPEYEVNVDIANIWSDVIKVLIGGLIGYIAGHKDEK